MRNKTGINQNLRSSAKQVSPKKPARPSLHSNFTLVAFIFYREKPGHYAEGTNKIIFTQ